MKISFREWSIGYILFSFIIAVFVILLSFFAFKGISFTQKKVVAEYTEGISSKLPMQKSSPENSLGVESNSSEKHK